MGQSRPLFCLFSFFSHYNFNTNWKKHRWCAWDSNPGPQDGRRRQNQGAMAATPSLKMLTVINGTVVEWSSGQHTCPLLFQSEVESWWSLQLVLYKKLFEMIRNGKSKRGRIAVWPELAIFCTLGNFLKPFATTNLPKSPTFLGNFSKGAKIINFSHEIIFGQLL